MTSLPTEMYLAASVVAAPVAGAPSYEGMTDLLFAHTEEIDPGLFGWFSGSPEVMAAREAFLVANGWTLANYEAHTSFECIVAHKAARDEGLI